MKEQFSQYLISFPFEMLFIYLAVLELELQGSLPLEPLHQPWFFFLECVCVCVCVCVCWVYLLRLASNRDPPDLCLPGS
jgi:hypothetical protein